MWEQPNIMHNTLTQWNWMVSNPQHLTLGRRVDIGAFTYMNAHQGIIIEDDVQIGSHCAIYTVSTIDGKIGPVHLKKNCKIGTHSTIMPNVTIGENSVIGAYSFVTRSIGDNEMWRLVPANFCKEI